MPIPSGIRSMARTSRPSPLPYLPPEILHQILSYYFARYLGRRYSDRLIRAPVYYACRALRRAALPFIYRAPRLDHPYQACKFLTLVDEIPELQPWVRQLVLPRLSLHNEGQRWQWQLLAPALHTVPTRGLRDLDGLREVTIYDARWAHLLHDIAREPRFLPSLQTCKIRMCKPADAVGWDWTLRVELSSLCTIMSIPGLQMLDLNGVHVIDDSRVDAIHEMRAGTPLVPLQTLAIYNCIIPPPAAKTLRSIRAVRALTMSQIHSSVDASCSESVPGDFVSASALECFRLRVAPLQAGFSPPRNKYLAFRDYRSLKTLHINALALGPCLGIHEGGPVPELKTTFPFSLEYLILDVIRHQTQVPLLLKLLVELVTCKSDIAPLLRRIELRPAPIAVDGLPASESEELRAVCSSARVEYSDTIDGGVRIYEPNGIYGHEALNIRGHLFGQPRIFESLWEMVMTGTEDKYDRERYENRWLAHVMGVDQAEVERLEPTWSLHAARTPDMSDVVVQYVASTMMSI